LESLRPLSGVMCVRVWHGGCSRRKSNPRLANPHSLEIIMTTRHFFTTALRLLTLAPALATASLVIGCGAADGSTETSAGEGAVQSADAVADLAKQLNLGSELPSPVATMRQFGTSAHVNRITLDARGNVLAVRLDSESGQAVLDGVLLGVVQSYGMHGYPMLDAAMGGRRGWTFDNGVVALEDPMHACEFGGQGPDDPTYPKCVADAQAKLVSRTPSTLGSSAGVITAVTVNDTGVPLAAVYLAYNHRVSLGKLETITAGTFAFHLGRIYTSTYGSKTTSTVVLQQDGTNASVETCTDDGTTISCRYLPHGR
jgi:hypothetical protein